MNTLVNEKFATLYAKTQRFTGELLNAGYKVVKKWECEFLDEKKYSCSDIIELKQKIFTYTSLKPRDGLYGGRTSSVCLFKEIKQNEKIKYVDFTSLYPFVQKKYFFPVGHPEIFVNEECENINIKDIFGLIKCSILSPQNLLFGVLPVRVAGKLLFPLCNQCAIYKCDKCAHSENDRCLQGTWSSVEINKAVDKGYKIIQIYEIYHYVRQEKIFVYYVNDFLKLKQEASGLPAECFNSDGSKNEIKINKYCEDYLNHEQISLDKDKIEKNPGLRTIAKTLLNSLWGKFAQNENNTQVVFLNDYEELLFLANDKSKKLTSLDFINDTLLRCTYENVDESTVALKTGNVVIACFVTAYARLQLYDLIEKLGRHVLYFDTDSVIYVCDENTCSIKTGNYLGELTNELKENEWITRFCSTGPKCYSYITNLNDEVVHVKGFSLKNKAKDILNFKTLNKCIEDKDQTITIEYENKICKDKLNNIFINSEIKKFSFTFNKRIVKDNFTTIPYGYLEEEEEEDEMAT